MIYVHSNEVNRMSSKHEISWAKILSEDTPPEDIVVVSNKEMLYVKSQRISI